LVCGPEQHVEAESASRQRCGVALPERGERGAVIEQAGVEEIGADAAGLEGELSEPQGAAGQRQRNESSLIVVQGSHSGCEWQAYHPRMRISTQEQPAHAAFPDAPGIPAVPAVPPTRPAWQRALLVYREPRV